MWRRLGCLVLLASCTGNVPGSDDGQDAGSEGNGSGGDNGGGGNVMGTGGNAGSGGAGDSAHLPAPLRRLSRFEYNNTVRDLLGDTTNPALDLPSDETRDSFTDLA